MPRLNRALWRRSLQFMGRRVSAYLGLGALVGVAMFAVELAFAYALQAFLVAAGVMEPRTAMLPAWMPQAQLGTVLLFILAVGVGRGLMNWLALYMQSATQEEFRHLQRGRILHWALHSESVSTHQAVMLFNEWTNNACAVVYGVQGLLVQLTSSAMLLAALLALSAKLSLIVGAALGVLYLPLLGADRKIFEVGRVLERSLNETNRRLVTSIRNLLLIQIYGTQDVEERHARTSLDAYNAQAMRFHRISAYKYSLPQVAGVVLICAITVAARSYFKSSPGVLVSYFYLIIRLLQTLSMMNANVSMMIKSWPETSRMLDWWEVQSREGTAKAIVPSPPRNGAVPIGWKLDNVTFRYPGVDEAVIESLSLSLKPGQCLVFTGPSGSGKSTVLNLLLGGLRPGSGSIEVLLEDGQQLVLEDFRPKLYPLIGYVGPESLLLEGTIEENLLYGLATKPSRAQIAAALEKAECGFVSELAQGLDYRITEQGQGLSAGQKQRLSLARAFLRQPRVLILDEATSNLDQETEARLVETLAQVKGEMTIVAATHRTALLSIADQRISLDKAPILRSTT